MLSSCFAGTKTVVGVNWGIKQDYVDDSTNKMRMFVFVSVDAKRLEKALSSVLEKEG